MSFWKWLESLKARSWYWIMLQWHVLSGENRLKIMLRHTAFKYTLSLMKWGKRSGSPSRHRPFKAGILEAEKVSSYSDSRKSDPSCLSNSVPHPGFPLVHSLTKGAAVPFILSLPVAWGERVSMVGGVSQSLSSRVWPCRILTESCENWNSELPGGSSAMVCFLTRESHSHLLTAEQTDWQRRKKLASFHDLHSHAPSLEASSSREGEWG